MTRKRWAALRDEHLKTPEQRASYAAAGVALDTELALWDFIERGTAAQAEVNKIIAESNNRLPLDVEAGLAEVRARVEKVGFDQTIAELLAFDGPINAELRLRMELLRNGEAHEDVRPPDDEVPSDPDRDADAGS